MPTTRPTTRPSTLTWLNSGDLARAICTPQPPAALPDNRAGGASQANRAGRDGQRTERLMAEIEKGQQMAGHQPSTASLALARRILDGTLTAEDAQAEIVAAHRLD